MSFKDLTPEQRQAMREKAAETRKANAKQRRQEVIDEAARKARLLALAQPGQDPPAKPKGLHDLDSMVADARLEQAPTLAELGFVAENDDPVLSDDILTPEEVHAAEEAGRKRYRDEQRAKRKKAITDAAYAGARLDDGATPPDEAELAYQTELVQVYIQMPRMRKPMGGEHPPEPILLDGRVYASGRTYRVERRVAVYLADLMDKARRHVNQVDGRGRIMYDEQRGTMIYQGGIAQGGPNGLGFDSIHRRPA